MMRFAWVVGVLGLVSACKNGGLAPDASVDARALDSTTQVDAGPSPSLPGCDTPCRADQVCESGVCVDVGPARPCTGRYPTVPASDKALYVDRSYAGAGSDGSQDKPFTTIGAALAEAKKSAGAGVKLTIAVGTGKTAGVEAYAEKDLTLDLPGLVTLSCLCPDRVQLTEPLKVAPLVNGTVVVDGCRVAPAGVTPASVSWPANDTRAGIAVSGTGAVLLHHVESVGWGAGISVNLAGQGAALCVARSRLLGNVIGADLIASDPTVAAHPFAECAGAAQCGGGQGAPCSANVVVARSRIEASRDYGVRTHQALKDVSLERNLIARSGVLGATRAGEGRGVYIGDANAATVRGNVIRDHASFGLGMSNAKSDIPLGVVIGQNAVLGNAVVGLALQDMRAKVVLEVTGNLVANTTKGTDPGGGDGIQITLARTTDEYTVNVAKNTVTGSARVGILMGGVATAGVNGTVDGNTISGSGTFGCVLQLSAAVALNNVYQANVSGNLQTNTTAVLPYANMPIPPP